MTLPRGARAIIKDMAKVSAALTATKLGADHAVTLVYVPLHSLRVDGTRE